MRWVDGDVGAAGEALAHVEGEDAAGLRVELGTVADPGDDERGVGEVREHDLGRRLDVLGRDDDVVADLGGHGCLFGG